MQTAKQILDEAIENCDNGELGHAGIIRAIEKYHNQFSLPVEAGVINKNADRTYIIYTEEGSLALSQEDILNTIDADLEMMDNEEEREWRVLRKDMTEEEINNLPVV